METREVDGVWLSREIIDVKYVGFDGLKEAIAEAEATLTNISFDVGTDYDYGDTVAYAHIEGWRAATHTEILARKEEVRAIEERQREYEAQQVEQLRRTRPELFK